MINYNSNIDHIQDKKSRQIISNLKIESSYSQNNLGLFLYESILKFSPKNVIEFGTLNGYSAVCMGLALKCLGHGKLTCYDLWDKYPFSHTKIEDVKFIVDKYCLSDIVNLEVGNLLEDDWRNINFDFCHIDISNDGDKLEKISQIFIDKIKKGIPILFEGGTKERDLIPWMIKYNKRKFSSLKGMSKYSIINENFPGISIFSACLDEEFINMFKTQ